VGIFTFFKQLKQSQKERSVSKNLKIIQNPKAIREERVSAIEYFKNLRDLSISVPALLKRFDYSLDHGIHDTREKESAMEGILSFGKDALPLVKEHLLKSTRIAWPIKVIQKLADDKITVNVLESCLFLSDFEFDRDKIDKNYDILCYLRDFPLEDQGKKLLGFLSTLDERLRFATAEVILSQNSLDLAEKLEPFITDTSAENTRIHQVVMDAFVEKGWPVHLDLPEGTQVSPGVFMKSDRRLQRR
jgi:hypothetical protein